MEENNKNKAVVLFEDVPVRRIWIEEEEKWYFSIIDVCFILVESIDYQTARKYWNKLSQRLREEGNEVVTNCHRLKLKAPDGKMRETDCANIEGVLRIIQSIPSRKAEPFKLWLAKVGYERLQETVNPEIAIDRARQNWKSMGAPEKWIENRMRGQEIRNKLTDYWQENGVSKGLDYAKLTNIIHKEWSGLTTQEHKDLKQVDKGNLRNSMTEAELLFTALAELSTTQIAKKDEAKGYNENAVSAKKGGGIAKGAREQLEEATGESVVTGEDFLEGGEVKELGISKQF